MITLDEHANRCRLAGDSIYYGKIGDHSRKCLLAMSVADAVVYAVRTAINNGSVFSAEQVVEHALDAVKPNLNERRWQYAQILELI